MSVSKVVSSSVFKSVHRATEVPSALASSADARTPPFNTQFVVDDSNNYIITDSSDRVISYINVSVTLAIQNGSGVARDLVAADISYIGYWQIYSSVRATPGSITFTPTDVSLGTAWTSGGIYSNSGNLRIYLPIQALIGDPDEIEIEITPVSGTVVILDPTMPV